MTCTPFVMALAACLLYASPAPARHAQEGPKGRNVNPDAGLIATFTQRVEEYVNVRDKAERSAADLEKTPRAAEIVAAEKSIAAHLRAARATAKRGDIFTPATQAMFRRLLKRPLATGPDAAENQAIMKEDSPRPAEVPFKVNAEYPKDVPLSTVPPDVLAALPVLPEDVQYRFAGKHLILYDARANLIIDFMSNALP